MKTKNILKQAKLLGVCNMLTGLETVDELCDLLFTPQGIEFCTTNNFPDMRILRSFDMNTLINKGVFIDSVDVQLHNERRVFIAGGSNVTLIYDDHSKRHEVIVMHGAKVVIHASNYAVVFVYNSGGQVTETKDDTAEIL